MTRIRIFEWLFAAILVVGLHGAALTAWIWMAPVSTKVALPAPTPVTEVVDADAIDIAVTLIEPAQSPEGLAVASPVTSQPAPVSPPVAVAEVTSDNTQIVTPAVPLEPASPPQPAAPQTPAAPQVQVATQGPAVLQDSVVPREPAAPQQPALQQEPVTPQAPVTLQEPVAPQEPAVLPGPAVLQDEPVDLSKDDSKIAEAVPLPTESLPAPAQSLPVDALSESAAATTDVAALPTQIEAATAPQPEIQPQQATPVSRSPLRDPAPIPRPKPAVSTAAVVPDEPATAVSGDQVASIGTEDQTEPEVNVLTPDRPETEAQKDYFQNLVSRITGALVYPDEAIQAGKEGIVDLQIVVRKDGRIASYDIIASSGHKELDDAAIQTLIKVNPVPPFPRDVTKDELRISIPLRYLIDRS